jgi:hypothetical protein
MGGWKGWKVVKVKNYVFAFLRPECEFGTVGKLRVLCSNQLVRAKKKEVYNGNGKIVTINQV